MLILISSNKKINLKNMIFLDKMCHLKRIKDKNNTLIIDCSLLNDDGIINKYNYFLEEVFITININTVISINTNSKIKEICKYYNLELIEI